MSNSIARPKEIKFSVIIPAYNAEKTIAEAIESVLTQSYPPYEIIVIDDASRDQTNEIIETKYATTVRHIKKVTNQGSSIARNTGMDVTTGDYIAFLDADDTWHPHKLAVISSILEASPDIHFLYHPYTEQIDSNKAIPDNIVVYKLPFIKLLRENMIGTPCAVISNDPSFRFEPTMRYTEDYDLWLRIGYKHKIYFITIPLTQISRSITSQGGLSGNKWKMRKGEMHAYLRLVKLNPLFVFLLPFLLLTSIGKHVYKKISKRPVKPWWYVP